MDVQLADGVTTVRIDHPPVNAFNLGLVEDAIATVRSIDGPIVLTGAGACFSAGVDLRALLDGPPEYTDTFLAAVSEAFLTVFDHPAPVVAAVNGHAIAGGCVLAMAADIRLMSSGLIGLSEVAVGVPFPVAALEICRYAMGPSVTRAVLQADNVDVGIAAGRGWIDEVVAPDELVPRAVEVARALGQHPATAYAAMKEQLHRHARAAIDAGVELDAGVRAVWKSDETRGRISAFLDALK
ncbi:enoyl-CoA hydratase/carnithine racemase [Mycobacterium sp. JS623]|uniref:enoyl-CoA hydratase/isomerase family protein n=1 Tax=Mycobacterium sp. JS623 TaxID=212767 RepID=UPI0002A594C3|nr:enoyl-CoA hydratase/isomerase family protein [Mycobacterium sp. JS623]AGB26514.1 enoyl-CoA hydratase/carnithine racemase [Mycobacterium sp. JS623]